MGEWDGLEAVGHHIEVGGATGGADGVFVLRGTSEEFVIDEGVGDSAVSSEDAVFAGSEDEVGGFVVGDDEAFFFEVVVDGLSKFGELGLLLGGVIEGSVVGFDGVDAFDPAVEEDVGAEDVDFDARVSGDLSEYFFAASAGLPELEFFRGHVDSEGFLGEDADVFGAVFSAAHFLDEGEFFEGGVEFAVDGAVEGEGIEGDILSDAGPFDDEVEGSGQASGEWACLDAVDGGGAFEALSVGFEPLVFVPVFGHELIDERQAVFGDIEVAFATGVEVDVVGAEDSEEGGFGVKGLEIDGGEMAHCGRFAGR